jgi:hypothetical protein
MLKNFRVCNNLYIFWPADEVTAINPADVPTYDLLPAGPDLVDRRAV